jgi:hypothetical protein
MPNTHFAIGGLLSAKFGDVTTDAKFDKGTIVEGNAGSRWMYVQAQAAVTLGDTVRVDSSHNARPITFALAGQAGHVGFAQIAFTTSDFGWVMMTGKPVLRLAASAADDVPLYTTDTAGVLGTATASLSQHQVMGLHADGSASAGGVTLVTAVAAWPIIRRPAA